MEILREKGYSIGTAFKLIADSLSNSGFDSPNLEARLLVAKSANIDPSRLYACSDMIMQPKQICTLDNYIVRRLAKEPIAYILGVKEFWSLDFVVTRATLIPRPETEILVDTVLSNVPDHKIKHKILDLGTGSGCILLALLSELSQASGLGVDISRCAVQVARQNALRCGLEKRAKFKEFDWNSKKTDQCKSYDIIVSNPPYIPSDEIPKLDLDIYKFEPLLALDGGYDGLTAFRQILNLLPNLLNEDGFAAFEIGSNHAHELLNLMKRKGFKIVEIRNDLASRRRVILIRW